MEPRVYIEGYAIVSKDGMLADANSVIPSSLKIEADQRFFQAGLRHVDLVVHGRNSQDLFSDSARRRRIILTRTVSALAKDPSNERAILWNPAGASFDQALAAMPEPHRRVAVIGGPTVFELFLDLFDVFYLSRADKVSIPGGRAIFRDEPLRVPEAVMAAHGLDDPQLELVDDKDGLTITEWRRREIPMPAHA